MEAAGRFVMVVIPGAWDVPKALAYMEDNGFRVEVYPAVGQSQMLFALFTKMK